MSVERNETFLLYGQDDLSNSKALLPLSESGRLRENSLDATVYSNSLKRKYEDEIDSFEEKHKRNSFEISLCVSPWEFRRLKADLMESQAQRIKLEDRIEQLHKKNKEAVIFFDKEKNEMKTELESNRSTIKVLEFRLNKIRKREIECKEELNEKVKAFELMKLKLGEKIAVLETSNEELNFRVRKLESDHNASIFKLNDEIRQLKEENEKLKLKVEEKEKLCSNLDMKLQNAVESAKKCEEMQHQLYLAQLKIKDLESEKEEFNEAKSITVALSEKVLHVSELEKELNEKNLQVANLKQFLHNNITLEEMVHDLKTKLATFEEKETEISNLKVKIVELESELEKWMSVATDFSTDSTRDSLRDYIESLQRKELTNNLEINNLNAGNRSSEKKVSSLQRELECSKIHNQKLGSALQKLKVEVQLLRKKSVLVSRERDSYRQQLDLYEKDLTLTTLYTENSSNDTVSQMKSRVQNLEVSLEEYRKHLEVLEAQLKEYQMEEPSENIETYCKLKEEIKSLEDSNKILTKQKTELEQKLENLASTGALLTPNTKILHFRNNPAFEAEKKQKQDLNNLLEECDKLRARVKLLESGEVLNITQKVSEDVKNYNSLKISELEKELQSTNLKMQRLKEVFKKTSQEFRDVSYMLLGYRIDLASNSKLFKLYNMYSTSPLDFLMFQQTKKGTMEMLGTTFAESMSKLVNEYLHKGNSIPAFLSAVTLALYELNTQSDEDNDNDPDNNDNNQADEYGENDDDESSRKISPEPIELD